MKYAKLSKDKKTKELTVSQPLTGEIFKTKDGGLVQVLNGKASVFSAGEWGIIAEVKKIKKPTKKSAPAYRAPVPSFMRSLVPSPELAQIVGTAAQPRTEVIKKLWAFVKKNGLQDTANRRMINVGNNELTRAIFKVNQISMFDITKAVAKHLSEK